MYRSSIHTYVYIYIWMYINATIFVPLFFHRCWPPSFWIPPFASALVITSSAFLIFSVTPKLVSVLFLVQALRPIFVLSLKLSAKSSAHGKVSGIRPCKSRVTTSMTKMKMKGKIDPWWAFAFTGKFLLAAAVTYVFCDTAAFQLVPYDFVCHAVKSILQARKWKGHWVLLPQCFSISNRRTCIVLKIRDRIQ